MIVLDEAWALISNNIFAPKIKNWLKVLRKLNTFVVFALNLLKMLARVILILWYNKLQLKYFTNLRATKAYRDVFMLSEREMSLVKTDPASRFFL